MKQMNKAGKKAVVVAKKPGHSPYLTGRLVKSIHWIRPQEGSRATKVVRGSLAVGVPYGRRQEFENVNRGKFLERAIRAVQPSFIAGLRKKNVVEDIIFGRRRQLAGDGVRGGFF